MPNSGLTASTAGLLVLDAGMLYHGNVQQGVIDGVVTFDPGLEMGQPTWGNKTNAIEGFDRIYRYNSTLTVGFKEFSSARFAALLPGSTLTVVGGADVVTGTDAGLFLASIADVRAFFPRGGGGYLEIRFPKAFPVLGAITGNDPGEGTFAVTYQARALVAGPDDAPFLIRFPATVETI